jgi:outer membrane protein assembly factor BamB
MKPLAATGEPSLVARTGKYVGVIVDAEASVQGLDRDSGHVTWMLTLRREFRLQNCSPRIAADQDLFFVAATSSYDRVLALDADTGLAIWSRSVGTELLESAVLVGGRLVVANVEGEVYGLDARTGETAWTTLVGKGPGELAAAGPYVLWHGAADVASLDASDGRVVWTKPLAEPAPLLVSDTDAGRFYVRGVKPPRVAAFALASGQETWSFPTHEEIGSPIVVFRDKVIFLEGRLHVRRLWVLDAKSGQPLASFDLTGKDVRFTARNVDANRYGVYIPVQEVQGEQTSAYIQFLPWDQFLPQVSPG